MPLRHTSAQVEARRASIAVVAALAFVPLALLLAVVMDAAQVWVVRERLQNSVEAAATASAVEWSHGGNPCSTSAMQFLVADGSTTIDDGCTSSVSSTVHKRTVTVKASETVHLRFARLLGRSHVVVTATTGVRITPAGAVVGLWPFALCADDDGVAKWIASGFTSTTSVTIKFRATSQMCSGNVPGNWAVIDYDGGSNSNADIKAWVDGGYGEVVHVGDVLFGSPGVPSSALDISSAVGRKVLLPLYHQPRLQGAGAEYPIVGFAYAQVNAIQLSGPEASRSFTITFLNGTMNPGAGSGDGQDYGYYKWSVCSMDNHGGC